ncbi:hypothetical protein SEVIR_9G456966v4 [Setaria viridis]
MGSGICSVVYCVRSFDASGELARDEGFACFWSTVQNLDLDSLAINQMDDLVLEPSWYERKWTDGHGLPNFESLFGKRISLLQVSLLQQRKSPTVANSAHKAASSNLSQAREAEVRNGSPLATTMGLHIDATTVFVISGPLLNRCPLGGLEFHTSPNHSRLLATNLGCHCSDQPTPVHD